MVVTNDSERADKLRVLRAHGSKPKYHHKIIGGNFRLDALQAAIVSAKLSHLDDWTAARQHNAKRYDQLFSEAGLPVSVPAVIAERHIFNQYVVRVQQRDELQERLKKEGVGTEVYYPVPMHLQECFRYLGYHAGAFPETERAAKETLALPIYPELKQSQINFVVECISKFFENENITRSDVVIQNSKSTV